MWCAQEDGEDHQHDERVTSVAFEVPGECDGRALNAWLGSLLREKGEDLFRSKGILSIHRSPEKCGACLLLWFDINTLLILIQCNFTIWFFENGSTVLASACRLHGTAPCAAWHCILRSTASLQNGAHDGEWHAAQVLLPGRAHAAHAGLHR
jgi:hypothetical protein